MFYLNKINGKYTNAEYMLNQIDYEMIEEETIHCYLSNNNIRDIISDIFKEQQSLVVVYDEGEYDAAILTKENFKLLIDSLEKIITNSDEKDKQLIKILFDFTKIYLEIDFDKFTIYYMDTGRI